VVVVVVVVVVARPVHSPLLLLRLQQLPLHLHLRRPLPTGLHHARHTSWRHSLAPAVVRRTTPLPCHPKPRSTRSVRGWWLQCRMMKRLAAEE